MNPGRPIRPPAIEKEVHRLVHEAEGVGDADNYPGKRHHKRFAIGMLLEASLNPRDPGATWPITMHNVSEGGFAFWSRRPLSRISAVFLREFTPDNSAVWLPTQVTHCTRGLSGYLIGAEVGSTPVDAPNPARKIFPPIR